MANVFPHAEHIHCAKNILANWHKTFKGDKMKLMFWKAAKAYNIAYYNEAIEELEKFNPTTVASFKGSNPKVFYRAFMKTRTKVDVIMNNIAETFNDYIINARTKHLIYMLEDIIIALMQRLVMKRQEMEKSYAIACPKIQAK